MPPDDIIVEVRDEPRYWIFVRPRDFLATSIATVIIEPEPAILHETVIVNETVVIRQHNFAVNPGIEPAFLAAEMGRPIPAFQVQPRILAGTANIQGAIQVRAQDLKREEVREAPQVPRINSFSLIFRRRVKGDGRRRVFSVDRKGCC